MARAAQAARPPLTAASDVVIFTGELDIATAPGLDDQLGRGAAGYPRRHLVIDLSGVTFMDCAGLRPLLAARNRPGAGMSLRNPAPPVTRVLRLLGLTAAFAVVVDLPATQPPPAPGRLRLWRRRAPRPVRDQPAAIPHQSPAPLSGADPGPRIALPATPAQPR